MAAEAMTSGTSSDRWLSELAFPNVVLAVGPTIYAYVPYANYGLTVSGQAVDMQKFAQARDDLYKRFGDALRELADL